MAYDYTPNITLAEGMIEKYGRAVSLVQLTSVQATGKPWRVDAAPPAAATAGTKATYAAFIGYTSSLGDEFMKDVSEVALIAGDFDVEQYHILVEGTIRWKIVRSKTFKPGDKRIVHFVGLSK